MKRFKRVYIEITNVCNLSCSFCPKTMRKAHTMDIDSFKKILDEVKPYTDYIYLHLKGEPLLHPNLPEFLDLCAEREFKVNITTNGTLLSRIKDKIIRKPSIRQVNISLHSFDANENSITMGEYLKEVLDFVKEALEKTNIIIALRLWNLDSNASKGERERNRELLSIIEDYFKLPYKIEEENTRNRGIKIAERLYLNQDIEFKWPALEEREYGNKGTCHGLKDQIGILADGTVVPCCLDGEGLINLGNLSEKSFKDIIASERTQNMLEGFFKGELREELCRKCGYRTRFIK
ncbi:MAG: radical SAM protein [Clostridiales bacterium]|uniref:radical SAM/SPASM domain-containing protein n=1 Tax=Clostridium sp. N3C TaxID=1776758 RepID=UPI00092E0F58|nr:radical SAM/SPASM domain-containing protein [Clostridium sp. N3C]NLZ49186.1 radical SAM protein [Clostridiales bacterium]SCN25112.1 Antilisterial bacteriocin subtilosin biosynthesis protein AlbA [Clostridium sp. N3C]